MAALALVVVFAMVVKGPEARNHCQQYPDNEK
jgi:hypothetical protein